MLERSIMAGFGGQGLMFLGKLIAKMMMDEGLNVTYFPSYGAEVRGGTANCHVIISSDEIASPVIEEADTLILMNQPSYARFIPRLTPGGIALLNTSLIQPAGESTGRVVGVPATQVAVDLGDVRVANMVMMGAYNAARALVTHDRLLDHLREALGTGKTELLDLNVRAVDAGRRAAGEPSRS